MALQINIVLAGAAGLGVKSSGMVFAKALLRTGMKVCGYSEYPSLIRGGHNTYHLLAATEEVFSPRREIDYLIALNQEGIDKHKERLMDKSVVIVDEGIDTTGVKAKLIKLPLIKEAIGFGNVLMQNVIAMGVLASEIGLDPEVIKNTVAESFEKKKHLVDINLKALEKGFELGGNKEVKLKEMASDTYLIDGSEAAGLGALAAGVSLYAAYPMTPSSPLLHYLAGKQEENGLLVRQVEDEIAAINLVVGASFAGAKAMTGTSGGGFALMQEGVSLSGMLELPVVIYLAMRPGPATGLPTWTSQSDLRFAIHSGHGEFCKIILAPGDVVEAYELTHKAFYLAQKYQTPVIILTDKFLGETQFTTKQFEEKDIVEIMHIQINLDQPEEMMFNRYRIDIDGVSDRTIPGVLNGEYIANSDEHNSFGLVDESSEMRTAMNQKRLSKINEARKDMVLPEIYGKREAKTYLVGFGSTKNQVLESMKDFDDYGFLHFTHIFPFPEGINELIDGKKLLFIENNMTGQFEGFFKEMTGISGAASLRKDDGRPFYSDEIVKFVKKEK